MQTCTIIWLFVNKSTSTSISDRVSGLTPLFSYSSARRNRRQLRMHFPALFMHSPFVYKQEIFRLLGYINRSIGSSSCVWSIKFHTVRSSVGGDILRSHILCVYNVRQLFDISSPPEVVGHKWSAFAAKWRCSTRYKTCLPYVCMYVSYIISQFFHAQNGKKVLSDTVIFIYFFLSFYFSYFFIFIILFSY